MASQGDKEGGTKQTFAERQGNLFADGFSFSGYERDLVMLSLGKQGFLNISGVSGADSLSDGRGSLFADFDNDGDLDIFLRAMHGPAHHLLRNNVGDSRNWLRVALRGTTSGHNAFGAIVRVTTKHGVQTKMVTGGSGFLGQSDPRLLFGLDDAEKVESIEITWPSGKKQELPAVAAGTSLLVVEGTAPTLLTDKTGKLPDPLTPEARVWKTLAFAKGEPLPDVTVAVGADQVKLATLLTAGRPALINFWATTCIPCRTEMPELQQLHGEGLEVVGISLDLPATRARIPGVVAGLKVKYPVATVDDEARGQLFRSPEVQIPLSIWIDAQHRAQAVFRGWSAKARAGVLELAGK
ncbi:MAG: hypothetical protein CMJ85_05420 [Planctomycetes bacterium]|nr:hypothetical protein [Planctomycetota bacterium]MDP6424371.1 ASPIC/UnbV domain-containing protein [Planctomycetota bacterium]